MLYDRYHAVIQRHVAHIVHDDASAHDLVQQTFLRVWTRADQWEGRGSFKAWLYRIAANLALNHLRMVRRRKEEPLVIADSWDEGEDGLPAWMVDDSADCPGSVLERAERGRMFQQLVEDLPEEKRRVVHPGLRGQ
jgi:RNA polymerase sigma-70 factor (ECF subfamily)